jgi:hypothetical protein
MNANCVGILLAYLMKDTNAALLCTIPLHDKFLPVNLTEDGVGGLHPQHHIYFTLQTFYNGIGTYGFVVGENWVMLPNKHLDHIHPPCNLVGIMANCNS